MSLPLPTQWSFNTWQSLQENTFQSSIYTSENQTQLKESIKKRWQTPHGDAQHWQQCLDKLPHFDSPTDAIIDEVITVSSKTKKPTEEIKNALLGLSPWRKGPFNIFDVSIDSEWQSHWKWKRIQHHQLDNLFKDAHVLDIGCGNGYYTWRMWKAGAKSVIGIDGSLLLNYQFAVCKHYLRQSPIMHFPIRFDLLPKSIQGFDVVVCMGVLSHTKEPLAHLWEIKQRMHHHINPKATLLLETLIIDTPETTLLYPQGRYAKMNNVFALPSPTMLKKWLEETGFMQCQIHDITPTSTQEQRATPWMTNQSLQHFLDPQDHSKTIEGYPAPTRLLLSASIG